MKRLMASAFAVSLSFFAAGFATGAQAQDMLSNVGEASGDTLVATGRLAEAGTKLVFGTLSLPFMLLGSATEAVGNGVRQSADAVWEQSNGPLTIGADNWSNDRGQARQGDDRVVSPQSQPRTWNSEGKDW